MAIIAGGEVVATGQPTDVIGALRGKVFRTKTEKAALARLEAEHGVIFSKLVGGQPVVRVLGEMPINHVFEPVEATLEDVYFRRLARREVKSKKVTG